VLPVVIGFGAVTAMSALDFEWGQALLHYALYLVSTIALRMLMGINVFWDALPPS